MTERVDLDAVRAQVMTVQTGGNVYVFADDYAALLAERDALEAHLTKVVMAYRLESMKRDDYSHDAFDQHLAKIMETV